MNELAKNTLFLLDQMSIKRKRRKLSQNTVARMLGSTQSNISTLEKAHRNTSLDFFVRWANAMGYMVTIVNKNELV